MNFSPSRLSLSRHLWWPLLAFFAVALLLELSTFDLWLADQLYALGGNSWRWRDAWLTRTIVHDGGRDGVGIVALVVALLALASCCMKALRPYARGLGYLLLSALVCGLGINLLKSFSHVDCPWDLLRYGGEFPYVRNFETHPGTFRYGACFPAGHASAAYAWLGLYYLAREYAPRWKGWALATVLVLGLIFGGAQQLRGAHFLSHDVWTLGLCWFACTGLYLCCFQWGRVSR